LGETVGLPAFPLLASMVFSAVCALASARRLGVAVAPTGLDHETLRGGLAGSDGPQARARLGASLAEAPADAWERGLVEACNEPDESVRVALVNEQLSELEVLANRWAGVPRVCARLATSVGFLCATIILLEGLAMPEGDSFPDALHAALLAAVGSLAAGIAGTAFSAAVHFRARRLRKAASVAADRLVRALTAGEAGSA
jgi:hypothetical protein